MGAAYREYSPPVGLEPLVACLWENPTLRERLQPVVPDGCVDLVWFSGEGLQVVGADTGPRAAGPLGQEAYGVRLRPGAAGAVLGLPASEVLDLQVPVASVWGAEGRRVSEAMTEAGPSRALALLTTAVLQHRAPPDRLVVAAARRLAAPEARVSAVARDLGLSARHLNRRTADAVGYGPKTLARVARFRRLIALSAGSGPADPLAIRALQAGYASQAHMNEDVRRLTGTTPVRFLKDAALTAA